ncbi:MAG: DUF4856 domain-containing protein [Flavobacteriales bacterium]|nr:DUF4856 domain-containing protein [Flavobacteriales bacterium]
MALKKLILAGLVAVVLMGCRREGCTDSTASNYDEKAKKDCCCEYTPTGPNYTVPTSYNFSDASGYNTVSYNGQQQRLEMLSEIVTYLKTANTAGTALDAPTLVTMYANSGYSWVDTDALGMNGSTKQLRSKTAGGDVGVQAYFDDLLDSITSLSGTTTISVEDGAPGVAGVFPNDGVKGPYLMTGDGQEYAQLIEKGLMCAVFMNQMTNNYLNVVGTDDNTLAVDVAAGKYYTNMEHHWDEAFGYFTDAIDYPTTGTDRFWGKYANSRESVLGSATSIITAFRTGRAAISNQDYTVRDAQIVIIKNEIEKVCAGTAIHYLNQAKSNLTNTTARNHMLSEAWAFINGLRFGDNAISGAGMSSTDIDTVLGLLGTDFNNVTISQLNNVIDQLAIGTGLTAYQATL